MDVTFWSFLLFLCTTLIYFGYGRPEVTLSGDGKSVNVDEYYSAAPLGIGLYILGILVSQLFLNIGYLTSKCGFNSGKNIPAALLYTFIPWIFIFGVLAGLLFVYPHLKSAFSNVVGYFVIAGDADILLSKMLEGTDIVMQHTGILVNQITIDNFDTVWKEIMRRIKATPAPSDETKLDWKKEMLALVVKKDSIGEAMWYIYSAIFVSSIVYYNLASKGCIKDPATMKAERDAYIEKQEAKTENAAKTATTYQL